MHKKYAPGTNLGKTSDAREAVRRALYGFRADGWQAIDGAWLDAAWAEVEIIKTLTNETAQTYKGGRYFLNADPHFVALGLLTNVFGLNPVPFGAGNEPRAFAEETVERWTAKLGGSPSGNL